MVVAQFGGGERAVGHAPAADSESAAGQQAPPALERHTVISSFVWLTCVIGPLIDVRAARFGLLI
jgi:hypothetical protein